MTDPDLKQILDRIEHAQLDFAKIVRMLSDIPLESTTTTPVGSWAEPLDKWWAGARTEANPEVVALYEKLVEHGHVMFRLAEQLASAPGDGKADERPDLMVLLREFQLGLGESLKSTSPHTTGTFSPMNHLVDTWLNQSGQLLGVPRNLSNQFSNLDPAQNWDTLVGAVCKLFDPTSVITPQLDKRRLSELVDALLDHQKHLNRFTHLAIRATADAVARMEVHSSLEDGADQVGVREFYAAWLDCCQETFNDLASDDEFIEVLGTLLNSAVRVRALRQRLADAAAKAAGIPSREEMRDLARALHETRRRCGPLKAGPVTESTPPQTEETADPVAEEPATDSVVKRARKAPRKVVKKKLITTRTTTKKSTTKKSTTRKSTAHKKAPRKKTVGNGSRGTTER